ncbi:hypothetical protein [Natronorarus salvus]|uniref:hypothetical protein n=1 Tax=Natronorarus salvus TaxID=3117733 RepID=UPI002F260AA5
MSPSLPDDLDTPDVGFVAAFGVYTAATLTFAFLTAAAATGAAVSTLVGGITSTVTVGLVIGSLLASRREGLAERLGRDLRSRLLPFSVPAGFGALSLGAFVSPFPVGAAVGAGLGTLVTGLCGWGISSMGRSRYARAVVSDDPILTVSHLDPRQHWWMAAIGLFSLSFGGASLAMGGGFPGFWLTAMGVMFLLFTAVVFYNQNRDEDSRRRMRLPSRFGSGRSYDLGDPLDPEYLPELRIHEEGIVAHQSWTSERFVPWERISGVDLTDDELRIGIRRGLDLRCKRDVVDDPEEAVETIERVRAEAERGPVEDVRERYGSPETGTLEFKTEVE